MLLYVRSDAWLHAGSHSYRCALGRSGIQRTKREGDGATPMGRYPIRRLLYRADRLDRPATNLPVHEIEPNAGWCDDPHDAAYNQPVELPYNANAERMWRLDEAYDLVVIIGHNDDPVVPGAGSAIFMHIASNDYGPTEGCLALSFQDLVAMLPDLDTSSAIKIDR